MALCLQGGIISLDATPQYPQPRLSIRLVPQNKDYLIPWGALSSWVAVYTDIESIDTPILMSHRIQGSTMWVRLSSAYRATNHWKCAWWSRIYSVIDQSYYKTTNHGPSAGPDRLPLEHNDIHLRGKGIDAVRQYDWKVKEKEATSQNAQATIGWWSISHDMV